ncbi:serine hydrolase domain-containing protein [Jidongwangia harbinensis]|uniref:serine hydrolase domain-containing protein n=1 Tax=Jidongwangia harbinensis TaxID=2878561 RepID=UPI001CD9302C|nr:serine hydrolase domain-containing protein [Jidongwangia harbinensis]MCA2216403.1 beta-lactamase family protein [Jidongwangia harbinensis]
MASRRDLLRIAGTAGLTVAAGAVGVPAAPAGTATGVPAHGATAHRARATGGLQAALDDIVSAAAIGVLAEVHDRGRVWRGAGGVSRLGTHRAVPVAGRFRAGSITKSFVAAVVLQLAGEGRLALDDTLQRWLPGVLPGAERITVRQLLQHTSGVANYPNTPSFRAIYHSEAAIVRMRHRTWTPPELVAFAAGVPLLFEPGTSWMYSNTNFVLLGMVVERVTGAGYAAEVRRRILRPLGLRGTRFPATDAALTGAHPHGYLAVGRDGGEEPVDITVFNPSVAGASGEVTSTAADLNVFFRALLGRRLLGPAEQEQMRAACATPRDYDYGLGLMTRTVAGGTRLWGHRGDIFGYYAESWIAEDGGRQLTVAATPWGEVDPKVPVAALVETVFAA